MLHRTPGLSTERLLTLCDAWSTGLRHSITTRLSCQFVHARCSRSRAHATRPFAALRPSHQPPAPRCPRRVHPAALLLHAAPARNFQLTVCTHGHGDVRDSCVPRTRGCWTTTPDQHASVTQYVAPLYRCYITKPTRHPFSLNTLDILAPLGLPLLAASPSLGSPPC